MEPETQGGFNSAGSTGSAADTAREGAQPDAQPMPPSAPEPGREPDHDLRWVFLGPDGLRAGWSVLIFVVAMVLLVVALGAALAKLHLFNPKAGFTPKNMFFNELASFLALVGAATVAALAERRRIVDYNLRDVRRPRHFFSGLAVGFAALSLLVGVLDAGGWLHFGGVALSGGAVPRYAAIWGLTFLLTGFVEEGTFRCYLQYTFTRGLNFWWALGLVVLMCAGTAAASKGHGGWGVYAMAVLGIGPCLLLHLRRIPGSGFWQAAWVTSTLFGFVHTGNGGENWIGIFGAAAIGFVFCVSVRVTGSAWWAIGCHAGWDWAETYFYGTPDSGLVARGHLLTTTHTGNALWSGGSDGPEGSLLALGVVVLLLVWLMAVYGRRRTAGSSSVIL
jgi:uncharacterized protein